MVDLLDENPICFLTSGKLSDKSFWNTTWEKKPAVFKATKERKELSKRLFGLQDLKNLAKKRAADGEPLQYDVDFHAVRYADGIRYDPKLLQSPDADEETIDDLFVQEKCTVQFHQPQRVDYELWRLCAALENQLGCLVGCNSYITPANTQGLPPHHDDVEIFVLQTEGTKAWKVYELDECKLANKTSGDIPEEALEKPVLEVTLHPGDVLYLPRGTIHQALAGSDKHSSHLTLSTYQRWSYGDLTQHAIGVVLADPQLHQTLPLSAKAGLPAGFLQGTELAGTVFDADVLVKNRVVNEAAATPKAVAAQLAVVLRELATALEEEEGLGEDVVGAAADVMSDDFMHNRLPPHPSQLIPLCTDTAIQLDDSVQCRADARCFRLIAMQPDGSQGGGGGGCQGCDDGDCEEHNHDHEHGHVHDEHCGHDHHHDDQEEEAEDGSDSEDDDDDDAGEAVRLLSCLLNNRSVHMLSVGDDEDSDTDSESEQEEEDEEDDDEDDDEREDLVFPAEFTPALLALLKSKGAPIKVSDIPVMGEGKGATMVQLQLAGALCEVGILAKVVGSSGDKQKKKNKKKGTSAQEGNAAKKTKKK